MRRYAMGGSIYKLYMFKAKGAAYRLSEEERNALMAKVSEALEKVGGKTVVQCDARWASEEWMGFGVEEFPDIEAVQKLAKLHEELGWFRYVESVSLLGTQWET
jgi:hypothetical protein